ELAPWSDVVVGDYNYYFDTSAALHTLTVAQEWRAAVLVDEAHNLVERARAMYSATLRLQDLRALLHTLPALRRARSDGAGAPSSLPHQASLWYEADGLGASATPAASKGLRNALKGLARSWTTLLAAQAEAYQRHAGPPQPFIEAMRQAAGALSDHLEHGAGAAQDDALRFYFDIQHFLRMAETFGSHS